MNTEIKKYKIKFDSSGSFDKSLTDLKNEYTKIFELAKKEFGSEDSFCDLGFPYFFTYSLNDDNGLIIDIKESKVRVQEKKYNYLADNLIKVFKKNNLEYEIIKKK